MVCTLLNKTRTLLWTWYFLLSYLGKYHPSTSCFKSSRSKPSMLVNPSENDASLFSNVIGRCSGITDTGVGAIACGCPSLEMINIAYNSNITDSSLTSLSKCSSLKALEIRGCTCVSAVGLSAIAIGCRQLMVLDVKKCFNINDNAMYPLAKFSHNLEQVHLISIRCKETLKALIRPN